MKRLTQHAYRFWGWLRRVRGEETGATASEYSLVVAFIAIVIVAGVGVFGIALNGVFVDLTTGVKTALGIP